MCREFREQLGQDLTDRELGNGGTIHPPILARRSMRAGHRQMHGQRGAG